jgi:predicted hydrolase (HD superfamily)
MSLQKSGDQLVDAKSILEAIAEVKRRGISAVMQELESIEQELAGHVMEELSLVYQGLLKTGAKTKLARKLNEQIESMALVSILALRNAQYRLWQENAEDTPLARIDPSAPTDTSEAPTDDSSTQ